MTDQPSESFLDRLINRAKGLFGTDVPDEVKPEFTRSVEADQFDELDWSLVEATVPALQQNIESLHRSHDYVPDTFADVFQLLHQGDPIIRERDAMVEEHRPNHELVQQFSSLPEVKALHEYTMHDDYNTAAAMLSMQPTLTEAFERLREAQDQAKEAAEARQRQQEANEALQQMTEAAEAGGEDAPSEAELEAAIDSAQQVADQAAQAQADAETSAEAAAQESRQEMRDAAEQAANERQDEADLMAGFGVQDGDLKRMSYQERYELAKKLRNNRLAKFAKLLGAFKRIGEAERRHKVVHRPDMVVGVELGDDLTRVVAGELDNLAVPETEDQFWLRFATRQLLQYKMAGTERLGQGPIIYVNDESGSMSHAYGGATREAWSKAFALSLVDQARRDGRDFIYIGFSSAAQQWRKDFPGGRGPIKDVIEFTEHNFNGGTSYNRPLEMALEIVNEYGERDKPKPDVVFVTDEEYGSLPEDFVKRWHDAKRRLDMHCYGIGVPTVHGNGALNALADNVRSLKDMTNVEQVADLFRTI